jgi:MFS transporter, DHA3 family, macrolide efflux protein
MNSAPVRVESAPAPSMAPFFALWTGQIFSLIGAQLSQFALVWWLTKSTGSATVLAFATMMALLPQILVSPIAGALVDRSSRRMVMMVADGSVGVATLILAALFATGQAQVAFVYALILVRATAVAFEWPAVQSSISLMVPQKHLARIAGLNQTLQGLAAIVCPPLGALLLEIFPMQGILGINSLVAFLAVLPLVFVRIPRPQAAGSPERAKTSVLADMVEGLRFVRGWPGLMMLAAVATFINLLFTPAFSLQPLLVVRHFGGGAPELAWLQSALGVGMVSGGLTLGAWGGFRSRAVTGLSSLALAGVAVIVIGLTPTSALPVAVAAMFAMGFLLPIANGSMFALMQSIVPPEVQGRVFALLISGSTAMSPIGLAIAGPVADVLGVQFWFVVGGIGIVAMGVGAFMVPAIRGLEKTVPLASS